VTTDRSSKHELPEAVKTLIEAHTGDAVYVVGPDYTIVHWDENMESLSGVLSEEALGKSCYETVMGEGEEGQPFCAHANVKATKELNLPRDMMMKPNLNPADLMALNLTKDLMNLEFFSSGHKSPRLQKAYSAGRWARFEHGESS